MSSTTTKTILVPGAWMGAWIWDATVHALTARGLNAETMTLRGLESGAERSHVAAIRLEDHVRQLADATAGHDGPVVLVSHSYSAAVTAQVADRLGDRVAGLIHIGGFLPADGRCLLDDWGDSDSERDQERADIADAGDLWLPPSRAMLEYETDLDGTDRDFLAENFTPHPGRTVTDTATLDADIATQPTTYVALSTQGPKTAWDEAPRAAREALTWRRQHINSGHWPMLSATNDTVTLLSTEIDHYAGPRLGLRVPRVCAAAHRPPSSFRARFLPELPADRTSTAW